MQSRFLIVWTSAGGEEREERWPSIERFRAWALAEGIRCAWRAFVEDDDGEWVLLDRGELQ